MQPDVTTYDLPLAASHDHRISSPASGDDVDELVAPARSRLRTPFGCFP